MTRNLLHSHGVLLLVIAGGLVARIATWNPFAVMHPDEIFQYLERAHRIAFGYGLRTFDDVIGIRNWIIPQILAPVMVAAREIGNDPILPAKAARGAVLLLFVPVCIGGWILGSRHSNQAGIAAAAAIAASPQLIVSGHWTLSENFAAAAIVPGAALMLTSRHARSRMIGSFLLVLGVVFRFQDAIFVSSVFASILWQDGWRDAARLRAMAAGMGLALLLSAASDLAAHQIPFAYVWKNLQFNVEADGAALFGTAPWWFYLTQLYAFGGFSFIILLLGSLIVPRWACPIVAASILQAAVLSFVGHKELRFVILPLTIITLAGGFGLWMAWVRWPGVTSRGILAATCLLAAYTSLQALRAGMPMLWKEQWAAHGEQIIARAAAQPDICGLVTQGPVPVSYALLGRPIPLYRGRISGRSVPPSALHGEGIDPRSLAAANFVIADAARRPPAEYTRHECFAWFDQKFCMYRRKGPCRPSHAKGLNASHMVIPRWMQSEKADPPTPAR